MFPMFRSVSRDAAVMAMLGAGLFGCGAIDATHSPPGDAGALAQWCTPEHGFALGRAGERYRRACPPHLEPGFRRAYAEGHAIHAQLTEIASLEATIARRTARMNDVQRELRHTVDALVAPDAGTADRLMRVERTKALSEEQGQLQNDLLRLNEELAVRRSSVAALRHSLAYGDGRAIE